MSEELAKEYLPKHAKKVFSGILFDVYHWEQKLFDGTTSTFEAVVRHGSVQLIVVNEDNTITLFEEEQPHVGKFISLPGGQVDYGENPEETARRELLEELGYECSSIKLWKKIVPMRKLIWPTYYYIVKGCNKIQEPQLDGGEKIKPFKVSFEEFLEYLETPSFRNKQLRDIVFRMKHTKDVEELKKELFN